MKGNSQAEPAAQTEALGEDGGTFTQFINITGKLSEALYLATHPEEGDNDEAPRSTVIQ